MTRSPGTNAERGRGERGAALITTLLMTTLLLSAGGALILTSSMAATTAADSTAEMQAYYAAEAGLEAGLAVVRRNVAPKAAGTVANFRTIVCGTAANCTNTGRNFSDWLTYTGGAVTLDNNLSYSLSVRDAALAAGAAVPAAPYAPTFLLITSTGYGPKGAKKQMQLTIRPAATIDIPGGVTLRGKTNTNAADVMSFSLGTSNGREFNTDGTKPVFITTNATDAASVTGTVGSDGKATYGNPTLGNTTAGTAALPSFLQSPLAAEQLIADLKAMDTPDDNIHIVDDSGTYDTDKDDTSGILLVTGTLKLGGNSNFTGIILVLGAGKVEWKGQGDFTGAMFVAKYDRTKLDVFDAPSFDFSGAGKSKLIFSAAAAQNELSQLGVRVAGIVEN
jgi:hypothetical protein